MSRRLMLGSMEMPTFQTTWNIPSNGYTLVFPFTGNSPSDGDVIIDWGDGNKTTIPANGNVSTYNSHQYTTAGNVEIKVMSKHGYMPRFSCLIISQSAPQLITVDSPLLTIKSNETILTALDNCFHSCTSLMRVSDKAFDNNTQVTTLYRCFYACLVLEEIPDGIFRYTILSTNFNTCFWNCRKLKINKNIFCDEPSEMLTRFAGLNVNFESCFSRTSPQSTANGGTAPQLWNYAGTFTSTSCFSGNGNNANTLTNNGDIPTGWRS